MYLNSICVEKAYLEFAVVTAVILPLKGFPKQYLKTSLKTSNTQLF